MTSQQQKARERRRYPRWREDELEVRTRCEAVDVLAAAVEMTGDDPGPVREACGGRAVLLHHRLFKGQGGALVSQVNTVAACEPCHLWIHAHPMVAHMAGMIIRQGDAEFEACRVSEVSGS